MAGNKRPWLDVMSLEVWAKILSTTAADRAQSSKTTGTSAITRLLSEYHMIDKRDPALIDDRKRYLKELGAAAADHVNAQESVDLKSRPSAHDRGANAGRGHKVQIEPGNTAGALEKKIDPWIASIGRRALKKHDYLSEIQGFVNSFAYTNSTDQFMEFVKAQATKDRSGALLSLTPGTKMEKKDPFHRDFEFHAHEDGSVTDAATEMSIALVDWIKTGSDVPFFIWLEGHRICTSVRHFDPKSSVSQINYHGSVDESVQKVWLSGSLLKAKGILDEGDGDLFTVTGSGTKPGHAFVWLADGALLSHKHRSGEFHHSSFTGGKKVRCAGTWKVVDGKITMMDNNSGHYQPTDSHFLTLLTELEGATSGATRVGTHSTVDGFGGFFAYMKYLTVADYKAKANAPVFAGRFSTMKSVVSNSK